MKPGKHILILTPGFAENEADKTCIPMLQGYLLSYAAHFPEDTLSVIAFHYPFAKRNYKWNGISIYSINGRNRPIPWRFLTWRRAIDQFKRISTIKNVDVIHSFWLNECALVGQYLAKKKKVRHISTSMGQDCRPENKYLRFLKLKDIFVVCLSAFMADLLLQTTLKKADSIIPFGLKPISDIPIYPRQIDIMGVGSIVPVKNYGVFIDIIKALLPEFPELRCMLIGNQPDREELMLVKKSISLANLENHVILRGQVEPELVMDYMRRAKIFLHTSLYEGQGLVFGEALACGMHVVSFDVGHTYPEKTYICKDKDQMIDTLRKLLYQKLLSFEPVMHETMKDTSDAYHHLYHSKTL
jgi:1,2-diacylglycerol 3-alpha-glucosyltransferase